jgi:hypothetical protein
MPEDAGKKKFIKDFLQRVKTGEGLIEDIWIERAVRNPGSTGEGSTARSLSGRPINNITELLEDDLKHSFDDGYFSFRIVSALKGSGKTSLLTYLHELTKTKSTCKDLSVVSRFALTNITMMGGDYDFSVKFYCHILAETFWTLLNNPDLSIKNRSREILIDYLGKPEVDQLVAASKLQTFRPNFIKYFSNIAIVFEEFFFDLIHEICKISPQYTFVYLIDEFDGLEKREHEFQQSLLIVRSLIKRAAQEFESKIHLFIYLVGTSDNIKFIFTEDPVIESLVAHQVINLNTGYENEFELIRNKIDGRIKEAFKGYKKFDIAWREIKDLKPDSGQTLRGFCKDYATKVLEIYETHFKEEPEKEFEGNARNLVEAECRKQWGKYLAQNSYDLSAVSTTTVLEGHAFDCYLELLHNGSCVARSFGEAKNYELLSNHLGTLDKWLQDVKFKPSSSDKNPSDLAFMIAPACPSLLQRKLELKNIYFIQSGKVVDNAPGVDKGEGKEQKTSAVNINTAPKDLIVTAFRGTSIKGTTVDRLLNTRTSRRYTNVDELATKLKLTPSSKEKLQKKLKEEKICFD